MAEVDVAIQPNVVATLPNIITERSGRIQSTKSLSSEPDFLTLPVELAELSEWLGEPFRRFLRLKQRNWPAKTVKQSTRQVFLRLSKLVEFFIQHYDWQDWDQLSLRWLDDYVDVKLREGLAPVTINWDLTNFRSFCRFLIDEEYNVPQLILRMKLLNTPRRLPRPLSEDQIRRLECCIQTASNKAKTEYQRHLAVRDLACFYLLWHCGLRNSEVCSLLVSDVDLQGRKLFIRDGKERKDRLVYMSDTTVKALHQHLAILPDPSSAYLFTTRVGVLKRGGLWKRLRSYGHQCGVPVTARRLRHTFASQMLAAGMPVTSLQRYLGHELLDTTMIYAEVSDPLLQQDYYQGIALLDPNSAHMGQSKLDPLYQDHLRRLLEELKAPELEPARQKEIMEQMQSLLDELDEQK